MWEIELAGKCCQWEVREMPVMAKLLTSLFWRLFNTRQKAVIETWLKHRQQMQKVAADGALCPRCGQMISIDDIFTHHEICPAEQSRRG